ELAAAATEIDVGRAHLGVNVGGRDPKREQPVGVQQHADLAVDTAVALDAADALQTLQLTLDDVVHVPRQPLERPSGRGGRECDDRLPLDVDAAHDGLVDVARELWTDLVDSVLDVVERPILVHLQPELDDGDRRTVGYARGQVLDAREVGYRVLD